MSEVSELSPRGNHSKMKPFQNKMSHNYLSSFNASLLGVGVGVGVGVGEEGGGQLARAL